MDQQHVALTGMIDTHFHLLEMEKRGIEPRLFLEELREQGFYGGIDIGISEDDIHRRSALLADFPEIALAAGIGPWGAKGEEPISSIVQRFATHISSYDYDCIGEIGLDNYWKYGTKKRQEELFLQQLSLAQDYRIPAIIHTRDADEELIPILQSHRWTHQGIIHCFSSSHKVAEVALSEGLMLSFSGTITFPKNTRLREILSIVPPDQLLLETDSPYLSPHPFRGKLNTPRNMVYIYQAAAHVLDKDREEIIYLIQSNYQRLFSQSQTVVDKKELSPLLEGKLVADSHVK